MPGWSAQCIGVRRELGGSKTNRSWHIERAGESFVLRIDTPLAVTLGLDRQREHVARRAAAAAGLAPQIVMALPEHGVTISEFVAGRTWTLADMHDAGQLSRLAACLRTLYGLPPSGAPVCLRRAATHYAEHLGDQTSLAVAREINALLRAMRQREPVLCHNDLVAQNLIDGEQLWLIDWEYAGVGDPLFDIAVVIEEHQIPASLAATFARGCLGRWQRTQREDVARYRAIYRRIAALWRALNDR